MSKILKSLSRIGHCGFGHVLSVGGLCGVFWCSTFQRCACFHLKAFTTEHAQSPDVRIWGDKHEKATVHFQWQRTLHFLQKHTSENYFIFIPIYVNISCEIQVPWRNEAQTVCKSQVQNIFVKAVKFTPLKMYNSLSPVLSANITHNASWFLMAKRLILASAIFFGSEDDTHWHSKSSILLISFFLGKDEILLILANPC